MTINASIECRHCKYDSEKRVVLVRKPLISNPLQLLYGYQEFYCNNKIKVFRSFGRDKNRDKIFKWFEEICENHILVKNNIIRRTKKCP